MDIVGGKDRSLDTFLEEENDSYEITILSVRLFVCHIMTFELSDSSMKFSKEVMPLKVTYTPYILIT
jgi:hypothetical protein